MILTYCHTFLPGHCFSCFGLDPDTPSEDYEIRLIRAADPAYIPPDSEAWPIYYQAAVESLKAFPAAFEAVLAAVQLACDQIRGRRALPPGRLHRQYPRPG